jgi:hypothetical protein
MAPPISLADRIQNPEGNSGEGQVDGSSRLTARCPTGESNVSDVLSHAVEADFAICTAIAQLSEIIDTYEGDETLLKRIEAQVDLLKESENSFVTGYGGGSIGVSEKDLTAEQVNA